MFFEVLGHSLWDGDTKRPWLIINKWSRFLKKSEETALVCSHIYSLLAYGKNEW